MNRAGQITKIEPAAGIPGGEVAIECVGLDGLSPQNAPFGLVRNKPRWWRCPPNEYWRLFRR